MKHIKKILLIDDDPIQLAIITAWLEFEGLEVLARNSPIGTCHTFHCYRPDLVLLDVQMPAMAGTALAALLAKDAAARQVPIIFYSGNPISLADLPLASPVIGTVTKTGDGADFMAQLRRLVEATRDRPRLKVLLVDDDPLQLVMVQAWLESDHFEVVTHQSSIGVTAIINRARPNVALIDVEMPVLSGPALVQTIERNVKYDLSIIFYSGKSQVVLDELVRGCKLVRGAIRKTGNGPQFMAEMKRLIEPRP